MIGVKEWMEVYGMKNPKQTAFSGANSLIIAKVESLEDRIAMLESALDLFASSAQIVTLKILCGGRRPPGPRTIVHLICKCIQNTPASNQF